MVARSKRKLSGHASSHVGKATRKKTFAASTPTKVLVLVHGAGFFPDDWYKPTVNILQEELARPFDFLAVYFADIANRPVRTLTETPAKTQFKADLEFEFRKSFEAAKTNPMLPPERRTTMLTLPAPVQNIAGTVRLVADYLFTPAIRREVQARIIAKLDEAQKKFDEIILVAHSLGTVACFDALKQATVEYNIAAWYTTGAPIAKLRRVNFLNDDLGAIRQIVKRWYNVYDTTDFIADPLGPAFPKPGYRLYDIFVDVGVDPNASHDYLNNRETIKLFADALM